MPEVVNAPVDVVAPDTTLVKEVESNGNENIVAGPNQCLSMIKIGSKSLDQKVFAKIVKEGGKRGVEIEGAADMGGLQFFCTNMENTLTQGNVLLLVESMKAMNAISDPSEEERKGGAGRLGKMIFSCTDDQFSAVAYMPKNLSEGENGVDASEWLKQVVMDCSPEGFGKKLAKTVTTFELDGISAKNYACVQINQNGTDGIFPIKFRDPAISNAYAFLRKKGLFPVDDDDSDDDYVFGDDDFPSM